MESVAASLGPARVATHRSRGEFDEREICNVWITMIHSNHMPTLHDSETGNQESRTGQIRRPER